jgi:hypothetical protein
VTEIKVTKMACAMLTAVDADGTPLHHGERMVETEPGVWTDAVLADALPLLRAAVESLEVA